MTRVNSYGFEVGNDGDALDASNSGADSFLVTGGTATITTTNPSHGTRALRLVGTSTSGYLYIARSFSAVTALSAVVDLRVNALPSADSTVFWFANGTSQQIHLEMLPTGALRVRNDANTALWDGATTSSTGLLAAGSNYRIEFTATANATTGTYQCVVYPSGDGNTPITGMNTGLRTGQNTGTQYTTFRIGPKVTAGTQTADWTIDDYDLVPGSAALIGPYTQTLATPAVVVTGSTNPTTVGGTNGTVTVTWASIPSAVSYDASIASGTVTSGFSVTTAGVTSPHTFTGLAAGPYTVAIKAKA